ncbi:MAG: RidA family protein [Alphaproteobacteria bacterium]|nr:RidA family protein [Alphaproteobacteria bacterium]
MSSITMVNPDPSQAEFMPYAPAVKVKGGGELIFISGATASPLYHSHPHVPEEHIHDDDIAAQTRKCMENIKLVLDHEGMGWQHIVRVEKYLTDIREADEMHAVMNEYMGDWKPSSTLLGVNNLSSPGARLELTMLAFKPDGE